MNILDAIKTVVKAIYNFIGKVINTILEDIFTTIDNTMGSVAFFIVTSLSIANLVFINGTDNITTHDQACFSPNVYKDDMGEAKKK